MLYEELGLTETLYYSNILFPFVTIAYLSHKGKTLVLPSPQTKLLQIKQFWISDYSKIGLNKMWILFCYSIMQYSHASIIF